MADYEALLRCPSVEAWDEIVAVGQRLYKSTSSYADTEWPRFQAALVEAVPSWPKEIPRQCPKTWPADLVRRVEHRVLETATYGHYIAKICGDPRLQGPNGEQLVWLERRFVGGVVQASISQAVINLLVTACHRAEWERVTEAMSMLRGALRNTGKVGTADCTGGVMLLRKGVEARLEVEVKVGDGKQRAAQAVREQSVKRRGGCYVLVNSVESAVQQILAFIQSHE